ncbi:hypothetical protein [Salinimicrobium sp. GXAS 041]|uniref:hypothetical protein n=1 Tax=Salinimicrobium sp. GXAS 041 TaxID=3400806 RepID=UPI003C764C3F
MKILQVLFVIFTTVFLLIEFRSVLGIDLPQWMLFYGKDFICMPMVLTICLVVMQFLKKDPNIRLSIITVFSLTTFYSLYFETILPEFHSRYTADFLDVLMYFSGALLFYLVQEKKIFNE